MNRRVFFIGFLLLCMVNVSMGQSLPSTRSFTTRDGLASNVVNTVIQDRQGYIWIGTNLGLTRYDGYRFVNFFVEEKGMRLMQNVTRIVEDTVHKALLMSGNDYKVLRFDLQEMRFTPSDRLTLPAHDEREMRLHEQKAFGLGVKTKNMTSKHVSVHYALLNDGREVYTTYDNGIFIYNPQKCKLLHLSATDESSIIPSDYVNDVLRDRSGNVWLATTFGGVCILQFDAQPLKNRLLVENATLAQTNSIRSFSQLSDTEVAISNMEGDVYRYNLVTTQSDLLLRKTHRVYTTATDSKGRLWVGTRGGGLWIDNRHLNESDGLRAGIIFDILFGEDGTTWLSTLDAGLVEMREKSDGVFSFKYHLEKEQVHQSIFDGGGCLWVATESGVFKMEGKDFLHIYNKGRVECLACGKDGKILAGTIGMGLVRIAGNGTAEYITTEDGLANNSVKAILVDKEGTVIATTDEGISVINHSDGSIRNLYCSSDVLSNVYNENAAIQTRNGQILLGNLNGWVQLEINDEKWKLENARTISPHITGITVNGVPTYHGDFNDVHLAHNQNNICIDFSSFVYAGQSSVIYSYWLEGLDTDWLSSTSNPVALYNNLSPGHYRFHVRSKMAGGQWGKETVLDILIAQPWWWTWWMRLFYVALIIFFVWYEWHQYQQRLSLRRQLDQRLAVLYATENMTSSTPITSDMDEDTSINDKSEQDGATDVEVQSTDSKNQVDREFLDRLDRFILANILESDLDISTLAAEMCMSHSTLYRRVKSMTGMATNAYIRKHRLTKAMHLLREGNNVSEVAIMCGFNSPNYFSRCFKSEYGISPSDVSSKQC